MCSNLIVGEVICDARIDENGDGLLFKKSSNFHRMRVGVVGQRVHYVVGKLGLFLCGFIFGFKARWSAHAEFDEKDRIFSAMRLSKASNLALMASSDSTM
ncbi:hypothetical protein BHE74_00013551 [Ensete ventricosum]|nr:hypothetical protein BHE74_00013551 [Ensete ventricosum]